MWPFNSPDDKGEPSETRRQVPVTTLARWYLYDMDVKYVNKLAMSLDLMPVSEEGDEKERQDSNARVSLIEPLIPFISIMSEINSKAVIQVQRDELPPHLKKAFQQHAQELEQIMQFYQHLSFAAIFSAFSSAAELGLIDVSGTFTSTTSFEEDE